MLLNARAWREEDSIRLAFEVSYDEAAISIGPDSLFKIYYSLYPNRQANRILFADTLRLLNYQKIDSITFYGTFTFKNHGNQAKVLFLQLQNEPRRSIMRTIVDIENQPPPFLTEGNIPYLKPYIHVDSSYLKTNSLAQRASISKLKLTLPQPANYPFKEATYDTLLLDQKVLDRKTAWTIPGGNCLYLLENEEWLSLVDHYFPLPANYHDMVLALSYLNAPSEQEKLEKIQNPKEAFDAFWLDLAGDGQYARALIRAYYSRMETANRLFTGFLQGWATDQGMVLMVLGEPDEVYVGEDKETWFYAGQGRMPEAEFTFRQKEINLGAKVYVLDRSSNLDAVWFQAIDLWKRGVLPR